MSEQNQRPEAEGQNPGQGAASSATTGQARGAGASEAATPGAGTPGAQEGGATVRGTSGGLDFVLDVPLRLTVEIGGTRMLVREVLQLDKGSVIELDRMSGEPADVLVNGKVVGRGEVTVVDDRLAVRLVELVTPTALRSGKG